MLERYKIDNSVDKRIEKYIETNETSELWQFGNNILYDMCKQNLMHKHPPIIAGKLWLIGRSYAAAIERRKNHNDISSEDFFTQYVIPNMVKNSDIIDNFLNKTKGCNYIRENNIDEILKIHKILTDLFQDITKLDKRSLASKYLHFHCPDLFFIYDSRAYNNIIKFVKKIKRSKLISEETAYDKTYMDFYYRALKLSKYIKNKYNKDFSPREIDNILVFTKD